MSEPETRGPKDHDLLDRAHLARTVEGVPRFGLTVGGFCRGMPAPEGGQFKCGWALFLGEANGQDDP